MNEEGRTTLGREALARRVREHVVRMATRGGCFLGASLSCVDILVQLYTYVLRIDPAHLEDPGRDYLLLSKGHDVPALYGTLAELGFFDAERLQNHLSPDDHLYWHPNRLIPGVEFHSGSLGHLASVGIGLALDMRLRCTPNRVFVVLGDGELNEGSVWEAFLVARALELDNLVFVVDRNQLQANARTEDLVPLEPLVEKLEAFGLGTRTADGHDFAALDEAFESLPIRAGRPSIVVARTVRNKGLPSIEGSANRWFVDLTRPEVDALLRELRGDGPATLTSAAQVVR